MLNFLWALLLGSQIAMADDPGFRVPHRFFERAALLYESTPDQNKIAAYIRKMAPNRSQKLIDNQGLAKEILHASSCFEIDPWIFTSLIHTESTFNNNATNNI